MARIVSLIVCVAALVLASASAGAAPQAVVELFTSQGCSSCNPAESYVAELALRDDVVVLSFHVDYWDYLGWRDTFGQAAHTARQRSYARVHGTRRVYTPQILVNGTADLVGGNRDAVEAAIAASALSIPISIWRTNGTIAIEVGAKPRPGRRVTTIWLVMFAAKANVQISRGENAGSTLASTNIVHSIRPIGMWDGAAVQITLPEQEMVAAGVDSYAVFVQEDLPKGPGAILGAAQLRDWR